MISSENDQPGINARHDPSKATSNTSNHHDADNDSSNSNMLNQSISSAFFKNLRLSGDATRKSIDHHPSSSSTTNNHHVKPPGSVSAAESGVTVGGAVGGGGGGGGVVSVVGMGHRSEVEDSHDNASLPPPPTRQQQQQQQQQSVGMAPSSSSFSIDGSIANASGFTNISMEYKRRETAAAVAQMKDRLRSMGKRVITPM